MKMDSDSNVASVLSEDLTEKNFGILANEKMFSILSSKIYSDKIAAPIRELSCNAYDAHVAAHKKDVPFKVHIPTWEELFFSVEDFGPGMDAYEIEELYTTYGYSSKTSSNRFVGCLGLGSKSPFAYTDSFRIVSRKKGKEYHYQCLIENGMPKLIKFDERDTDQHSGVKVEFNVSSDDIWTFRWKAAEIFRSFAIRPETNEPLNIKDYPEFHHGIAINPKEEYSRAVLMGNVAYTYNLSSFKGIGEFEEFFRRFNDTCTVLQAEIGDIEIAASRESAEMSPKTMKFIARKHVEFAEKLLQEMKAKKSTYNSTFEYLFAYGHFLKEHRFVDRKDFMNEAEAFTIPLEKPTEIVKICNRSNSRTHDRYFNKIENELKIESYRFFDKEIKFVYVPEGRLVSSQAINDTVDSQKGLEIYLFNSEELKNTLESMNIHVYEKKDFKVEKVVKAARKTLKDAEGLSNIYCRSRFESDSGNYGLKFFSLDESDLKRINEATTIYYVKTKFRTINFYDVNRLRSMGFSYNCFNYVINYLRGDGDSNLAFIGVNSDRLKKVSGDERYVDLVEYMVKNFPNDSDEYKNVLNRFKRKKLENDLGFAFLLKFNQEFLTDDMNRVLEIIQMNNSQDLTKKEQVYEDIYNFNTDTKELVNSFQEFMKNRYPMTRFMNLDASLYLASHCGVISILQNYIDEIDNKELSSKI